MVLYKRVKGESRCKEEQNEEYFSPVELSIGLIRVIELMEEVESM